MARSNRSARQAGARFERQIADYLAQRLDDRIDRRVKTGAKDKGDIAGVRTRAGNRLVIECKNTTRTELAKWINEAHTEAENDNALTGLIVHKRHGKGQPQDQWVTMTLHDLTLLLEDARTMLNFARDFIEAYKEHPGNIGDPAAAAAREIEKFKEANDGYY